MKKVKLDKIASVTKNVDLSYEVELSDQIVSEEGAILAVKVLEDKELYNSLELTSGRMSTLHKGDIITVVLGSRRALKGFVGDVPDSLEVGDKIQILNLGGVAGSCVSGNMREVGDALNVEVLGSISDGEKNLNIKDFTLFKPVEELEKSAPLVVVIGTCMHVGKTTVASEIIKHARRKRMKVFAAKLAGIAAQKDTENMKDYGAKKAVSFLDAGYPSTVGCNGSAVKVAKGSIQYLSEDDPDYVVIEFGDGLFGEYGVMDCLKDPEIQKNIVALVGCAHDPAGAIKLAEECEKMGVSLDAISGPVTDNSVGTKFIEDNLGIAAFNVFTSSKLLFNYLQEKCLKK